MKFVQTAIQYCVELSTLTFTAIMNEDSRRENKGEYDNILASKLDKIDGVSNVDYNGHFGPNVFFTLDMNYKIDPTIKAIRKMIDTYVEGEI
jgi:hypothetical protein